MEDILASIRRILNEDDAAAAPAGAAPPTAPDEEPLALTEAMLVAEPPRPESLPVVPVQTLAPPATVAASQPLVTPVPQPAVTLVEPAVAAAAAASVGQLLRTVAAERSAAIGRGGPTIEDVVRQEIRPLLKEWLDQHLPPLVERLVRAEIERVVGRTLS